MVVILFETEASFVATQCLGEGSVILVSGADILNMCSDNAIDGMLWQ